MKAKSVVFVIGIFLTCFLFCGLMFWVVYPLKYKQYILKYSKEFNISAELVASVICAESRFRANVTSDSGACGLMQLMPKTFSWVCDQLNISENCDIYNPELNINAGCYYLNYLMRKYNNLTYVLACYNAGEGVVSSWGDYASFSISNVRYAETQKYIIKVNNLIRLYSSRLD